jgi:hypothetical protein
VQDVGSAKAEVLAAAGAAKGRAIGAEEAEAGVGTAETEERKAPDRTVIEREGVVGAGIDVGVGVGA